MADLGSVILADSHRRIVERREGVGPDIDYLRGISLHGLHDVQDMFPVQLQEPAANDSGGYVGETQKTPWLLWVSSQGVLLLCNYLESNDYHL